MKIITTILGLFIVGSLITFFVMKSAQPLCQNLLSSTEGAAKAVALTLECKNIDAITTDITNSILTSKVCKSENNIAFLSVSKNTIISDFVCPQIGDLVINSFKNSIPENWECSASIISDILRKQILDNCVILINK